MDVKTQSIEKEILRGKHQIWQDRTHEFYQEAHQHKQGSLSIIGENPLICMRKAEETHRI